MNDTPSLENTPPIELFLAYLARELDEAGVARLSALIESDPAFRREAAIILRQEQLLYDIGRQWAVERPEFLEALDAVPLAGAGIVLADWKAALRRVICQPLGWGLAGAATAIVALLSIAPLSQLGSGPKLVRVTGRVSLERQGKVRSATAHRPLRAGDRLQLAPDAAVELAYPREATSLRVWGGAQLRIDGRGPGKAFTLHQGELSATVAPQPASSPLRILTPHGSATVVGTDFCLTVSTQATRLEVWQGKVQLLDGNGSHFLNVAQGETGHVSAQGRLSRGTIQLGARREYWLGQPVPGVEPLGELGCLARRPDLVETVSGLSGPSTPHDRFVSRVTALLRPSVSGSYEFWVAGDDRAELWLSSDATPEHKKRIAWTTTWCQLSDWDLSPTQKSRAIRLEAGRKYYLEVLQYDQAGGDFVAVAWQAPKGQRQAIPGAHLILDRAEQSTLPEP